MLLVNDEGEWESESDPEGDINANHDFAVEDDVASTLLSHNYVGGEALVVFRSLSAQVVEEDKGRQHNLFHTCCLVNAKVCRVIIDSSSCNNIASTEMVEKLGLQTNRHPHPYHMQWLNNCGLMRVTCMVRIPISVGTYHDVVECDVVPMHACHLLLGCP